MNPYQCTKRAADTLSLIMENRLQFRPACDGTVPPFDRRWRTVGGHVGWHEALLRYANLFLDAGLIDHTVEKPGVWAMVYTTRAGKYLFDTWRDRPFAVINDGPEAIVTASQALSAAYLAGSGLLEDDPHRYAEDLRPHVDAVIDALRVDRS